VRRARVSAPTTKTRENVNVTRLEQPSERAHGANGANERVVLDSDKSDDDGHDV
jgi:hypothetical protein